MYKYLHIREFVRILDLRVQVHPGELWVSKQRMLIVLEASKSAGAKGDVPKICWFVHPPQGLQQLRFSSLFMNRLKSVQFSMYIY